ncbi:DUF1279 super [Kalmusia sp. IMI 367209]|nr:DUF1279 super [Kalmusia sp. IMI 367209]
MPSASLESIGGGRGVADLPFCFLAVRYIGAERVAYAEHVVLGGAKDLIGRFFPTLFENAEQEVEVEASEADKHVPDNEGGNPSEYRRTSFVHVSDGDILAIWTQLGLAFVIHKSFIFIRVPLTAAITPKVVKTLRGWGYNIGKRTPKSK